jgi:hypothetical protein
MPFLIGYFCQTISQANGQNGDYPELPEWTGNWGQYFSSGLKLNLFYYFLMSPILLLNVLIQASSMIVESNPLVSIMSSFGGGILLLALYVLYFFITPFLLVPIYSNTPQASFSEMLNINNMLEQGRKHYGDVMLTMIVIFVIQMLFSIVSMIFGLLTCCIGFIAIPVVSFGLMISNGLMLSHAYEQE